MRKLFPLFLLCFFIVPYGSFSQVLNGRVRSEEGSNAAGVSVRFRNATNGIATNTDGTFRIRATKLPDTLDISGVGFEPYYVVITEKNIKDPNFEVVMLNTRSAMSEVVVTSAYGVKRKSLRNITGSVSGSGSAGLSGKVPGLYVEGSASAGGGARDSKLFLADTNIGPRTGMAAKSRILTAGEVNDFNKWKMWEDYTENEFKGMGNFWGMMPDKRYTVQLTDRDHNAIINEPVFLVDKSTKDTAWRAITDNTGKAELWAGFLKDSVKSAEYVITDRLGNIVQHPTGFANGVNLLTVSRTCGVTPDVDSSGCHGQYG